MTRPTFAAPIVLATGLAAALAGCVPPRPAPPPPRALPAAAQCPHMDPPAVAGFPPAGLRGTYQFEATGAQQADRGAFLGRLRAAGFVQVPATVNVNGRDTLVALGPAPVRSRAELEAEFDRACAAGHAGIALTHARYDPWGEQGRSR